MERQISALTVKVKELEETIAAIQVTKLKSEHARQHQTGHEGEAAELHEEVAQYGEESQVEKRLITPRSSSPFDLLPDGILARLGLVPEQEGLPTRMRELPAYLFFVGVGVGAVMMKVLFSRSR